MKRLSYILAAALMVCTLSACHNRKDTEEHHHEEQQITQYTDIFELYAEASPLIVGEESTVLSHFTWLKNFKPLDSTKVTMTLTVGNKSQQVTIAQPEKAGIYKFAIKPQTAGEGSLTFTIALADSVATIVVPHIDVFASHEAFHNAEQHDHHFTEVEEEQKHESEGHDHDEEGEEHHHETANTATPSNAIAFTKEQSWKIDFATEVVKPMPFGQLIKVSAQVQPSQGDQRSVTAKASGVVVFANPNLVEGSSVSAGQRLISIQSDGMADNNMSVRYQEASANYTLAKQEYERKQALAKDKIVSQSDLERARAALESAAAVYRNLKRNFSQSGQSLSAPISGYVTTIAVSNGSYVEAGQTVMTVSKNRDLFIRAEVQPRYYSALSHILSANFRVPNSNRVYSIDSLGGGLVSYGKSTDQNNPLIPVTFRFRNSVNLLSGSFVTLYIRTESDENSLTIPNTGIVEEMGSYFVFVQINPELFEKRPVVLGATDGQRTIITSGVNAGERVVSKGAVMVKLAQASGALDPHAGHVH